MKRAVLHFRAEFLPPTETFIARQIEGQLEAGEFEPYHLCCTRTPGCVLDSERVYSLHGTAVETAPLRPLNGRERALRIVQSILRRVGLDRKPVRLTPDVRLWLKSRSPSLVHAHFGDDGYLISSAARKLGIPLVVTFYGYDLSAYSKMWVWRRRYRRLFEQSSACLVEGSFMRQRLVELGCPSEKARLVRNPVSTRGLSFRARRWRDAGREPVRLLFTGRFVEKKGLVYALRALAELRAEFPYLCLHVVGDGALRASVHSEIHRLELGESVILHGALPYDKLVDLMGRCDLLVVPSVTARNGDSEGGAPNILLDAQASGMPVVATTHCDIPEFVGTGGSALLAAERDARGLAECLRTLLRSESTPDWESMGRIGRQHVQDEFESDVVMRRIHALYEELLAPDSNHRSGEISLPDGETETRTEKARSNPTRR